MNVYIQCAIDNLYKPIIVVNLIYMAVWNFVWMIFYEANVILKRWILMNQFP